MQISSEQADQLRTSRSSSSVVLQSRTSRSVYNVVFQFRESRTYEIGVSKSEQCFSEGIILERIQIGASHREQLAVDYGTRKAYSRLWEQTAERTA
ncbi:hypothetical protein F511_22406 [Dorcoceras hygrometricum]|uniref:Uncharacterized protein n=1 Tax=Dorcoceras hygrometricum TaxID=472368 RepID=A0A2Z7C9B9_9LAMI|nr:hypothetical protein F511_22406 [Dorcoceras hygrometricum]